MALYAAKILNPIALPGFPCGLVRVNHFNAWGFDKNRNVVNLREAGSEIAVLGSNEINLNFQIYGNIANDGPLISETGAPAGLTDLEWNDDSTTMYYLAMFASSDGNLPTGVSGDELDRTTLNPCEFVNGYKNGYWRIIKSGNRDLTVTNLKLKGLSLNRVLFFWIGIGNVNTQTKIPIG